MSIISTSVTVTQDINSTRGQLGIGWSGVGTTGNLWDIYYGANHYCMSSASTITITLPTVGTGYTQAQPGFWTTILNTNPVTYVPGNNIILVNSAAVVVATLLPGEAIKLIADVLSPVFWCVEYNTDGMSKASVRANIDPSSNPDPVTNGLIIPAGTPEFNMPITVLPQGLSIADGFIRDAAGVFTVGADSITINRPGHFRVSLNGYVIGSVNNESKIMQVIETMFPIFSGPPACVGASYTGNVLTVPFPGIVWAMSSTSDILVTSTPVTVALKCLFDNPTSDVVLALTSNMSINEL